MYPAPSHSNIILLQEHWLWPFEMQKLPSAIDGSSAFEVSDSRLCDTSTLHWGCRTLSVTPVTLTVSSDHICATELPLTNATLIKSSSLMSMLPLLTLDGQVSTTAYVTWKKRSTQLIPAPQLLSLSEITSVSTISRRRLTQWNTASISTTFTDLESMERPGGWLDHSTDCTSESGEWAFSLDQVQAWCLTRLCFFSYAIVACDEPLLVTEVQTLGELHMHNTPNWWDGLLVCVYSWSPARVAHGEADMG